MARRRKLGRGSLVIGGLVIIAIAVMFVMFPLISGSILGGVDSNDYRFAFPDIDNIILPSAQLISTGSTFECFFKYTIVAKNVIGQKIQTQESDFNFNREIFVDLSISAPTGQTIDKYEVTPKIRCNKTEGNTRWGTGLVVLPSSIQLSVKFAQPDGTTTTLPTKSLTVQSTGSSGTIIATGDDLFGIIPNINPFDDIAGILPLNQEIEFKGTLGALKSANEFWTIDASEIDNKLQALPDRYSSDVTFQVFAGSGTGLNIRNIFTQPNANFRSLSISSVVFPPPVFKRSTNLASSSVSEQISCWILSTWLSDKVARQDSKFSLSVFISSDGQTPSNELFPVSSKLHCSNALPLLPVQTSLPTRTASEKIKFLKNFIWFITPLYCCPLALRSNVPSTV